MRAADAAACGQRQRFRAAVDGRDPRPERHGMDKIVQGRSRPSRRPEHHHARLPHAAEMHRHHRTEQVQELRRGGTRLRIRRARRGGRRHSGCDCNGWRSIKPRTEKSLCPCCSLRTNRRV